MPISEQIQTECVAILMEYLSGNINAMYHPYLEQLSIVQWRDVVLQVFRNLYGSSPTGTELWFYMVNNNLRYLFGEFDMKRSTTMESVLCVTLDTIWHPGLNVRNPRSEVLVAISRGHMSPARGDFSLDTRVYNDDIWTL